VFTGYKGGIELARLFASLDVFVHTGAHETFCQTIQEALASGVPVVAPAVGGPLDLVRQDHNGLLYRPEDGRALRRAVGRITADPVRLAAMANRCRPDVEGRTWAALTAQLVGHYHTAIQRHAARQPTPVALTAQVG
jgi:phosphatidylinositol alpha 1,6-mannosyltransferase